MRNRRFVRKQGQNCHNVYDNKGKFDSPHIKSLHTYLIKNDERH